MNLYLNLKNRFLQNIATQGYQKSQQGQSDAPEEEALPTALWMKKLRKESNSYARKESGYDAEYLAQLEGELRAFNPNGSGDDGSVDYSA